MTNREFSINVMDPGEANGFIRMWETWLKKVQKPYEPIWIKEQRYEEFMNMEFSPRLWEDACTPKATGTVPKDFMRSIKWAFRFTNRDEERAKKKREANPQREMTELEERAEKLKRRFDPRIGAEAGSIVAWETSNKVKDMPTKNKALRKF